MRPADVERAKELSAKLVAFRDGVRPLPGISEPLPLAVLVEQMIDSLRRVEFAYIVRDGKMDPVRANPASLAFDPLRAAVYWVRRGNADEACWLVFLFVHFGKHTRDGYRLLRDIYGALGEGRWTWERVQSDPSTFREWLRKNEARLKSDGVRRRFGNHRKYESLSAISPNGTAAVVASYVAWVGPSGLDAMIREAHKDVGQDPREVFRYLYNSMSAVARFGRLAKFDFLTMLGKLGIAPIEPDSAYLSEATGPQRGAKLLFGGSRTAKIPASHLEEGLLELDVRLQVGMQVLEDSLCNWQKSPNAYVRFRG